MKNEEKDLTPPGQEERELPNIKLQLKSNKVISLLHPCFGKFQPTVRRCIRCWEMCVCFSHSILSQGGLSELREGYFCKDLILVS
ncbi:Uncharacterised protein [uncultured archaeon]|nr:Uncharacterised protein [uncultured archaeon]